MQQRRFRFATAVLVLAVAGLALIPSIPSASHAPTLRHITSSKAIRLAASAPVHSSATLEKTTKTGTAVLGGTSVRSNSHSAASFIPSSKDFTRPTSSPSINGAIPKTPSASLGGGGGATSTAALNAYDSGQANFIANFGPLDIEPPDQGLCVGNGYAVDAVNLAVQVYNSSTLATLTSPQNLSGLLGFPVDQQFGVNSTVGGGYILSDPRCLYDVGTGHWFLTFLYLGGAGVYSNSGPFPLGNLTYGEEFVLVSQGTTPIGKYNIYSLNVTNDSQTTNCPCFGDQPLLGADANLLLLSTNEYPVFSAGFNGAQLYAFDKSALASGATTVDLVHFNIGQTINPPDGNCAASGGAYCFYSVDPTVAPTTGSYDPSDSGTAWAVSSLDFTGAGDTRLAVWSIENTSTISSASPSLTLTLTLLTGLEFYGSLGQLVSQASGAIPLGRDSAFGLSFTGHGGGGCVAACPVGKLASNGDGTWNAASYAQGAIWVAVSTVAKSGGSGSSTVMGAAYWVIEASGTSVSLATEGYIASSEANLLFPSVAAGPDGNGLVTFTLAGHNNYPSTAYAWISSTGHGPIGKTIYVSAAGKSPQDGFSEYQSIQSSSYRPRWGDYTFAIWSNGQVYFAGEYIQSPNCSNAAFLVDPTCGGTRDAFANWGTSLNFVADP